MASHKRFLELLDEIKDLHERKFGVNSFIGVLVRISDKFIRISNLVKNPKADQVGESIKDTLLDLSIYCLIAICLFEEEQDPNFDPCKHIKGGK